MKLKDMTTICQVHDFIISKANELLKTKLTDYEDIGDAEWEIHNWSDDILDAINTSSIMASKMEDRLKEYKDAIKGLGFKKG